MSKKFILNSILLSSSVLLSSCDLGDDVNKAYDKNHIPVDYIYKQQFELLEDSIYNKQSELMKKIDAKHRQYEEQVCLFETARVVTEYFSTNPEKLNREKNDEYIKILKSSTELKKKYEGELQELEKDKQFLDEVNRKIYYLNKK